MRCHNKKQVTGIDNESLPDVDSCEQHASRYGITEMDGNHDKEEVLQIKIRGNKGWHLGIRRSGD